MYEYLNSDRSRTSYAVTQKGMDAYKAFITARHKTPIRCLERTYNAEMRRLKSVRVRPETQAE